MTPQQQFSTDATRRFFRPRRLTHINLWVKDVKKVTKFYQEIAGFEEAYRRDKILAVFLSNGNTYHDFALFDVDSMIGKGRKPGVHHIAFELENEVELVKGYNEAQAAGFQFDYSLSADVAHSVYFSDPDGNSIELYADVFADWRSRRHGEMSAVKPDWKPGMTPPVKESCYPVNPEIRRIESAAFHGRRTAHVAFVVDDYVGSVSTYTKFAGLDVLAGGPESDFTVLGGSLKELSISLFKSRPNRASGLHHIGIEVWDSDDLEKAKRRLADMGIPIELEIVHPLRHCIYVRDPDGRLVQFFANGSLSAEDVGRMDEGLALHLC